MTPLYPDIIVPRERAIINYASARCYSLNGRTNGRTDVRTNGWVDGDLCLNAWVHTRVNACLDGWMDGWGHLWMHAGLLGEQRLLPVFYAG